MVPITPEPPRLTIQALSMAQSCGRRLPLVSSMPNMLSDRPRHSRLFFDEDGPGELIEDGPRHDNDYADFRDINILPTIDEILSINRPVYMPKKNTDRPHFHKPGLHRLLDTHFRHLRYDSTESIRDICYHAAQQAFLLGTFNTHDDLPYQKTPAANRYQMYSDVNIEGFLAHEQKGMLLKISFDCPSSLQGPLMHRSSRLQSGMMCALMAMDMLTEELSIIYFDVHLRQSTFSMEHKGVGTHRAAVQLAFHQHALHDEILQITRWAFRLRDSVKFILVEFPKVLHAGFHHPLRRLQQIEVDDIAFGQYLAPSKSIPDHPGMQSDINISPPRYCTDQQFEYDLSPLTQETPFSVTARDLLGESVSSTIDRLLESTSLDKGQAIALCNSLGREFAFTQGPPGTGKTYLGVAITQVLLASRSKESTKPVIVVCLTNHALDAFLAGLRDAGVSKLLRLGAGSKEEWTRSIALREKTKKHRFNKIEFEDLSGVRSQKKHVYGDLASWCQSVSNQVDHRRPNWHHIGPFLKSNHPHTYRQLVTATDNTSTQSFAFDYWAEGGDLNHIGNLHRELAERLVQTTSSRSQNEQDLVERLLQDISSHILDNSSDLRQDKIWALPPTQRKWLIAE